MNNFYFSSQLFNKKRISIIKKMKNSIHRSSHPEVFLGKAVLKICSIFTGEHPRRSAILIKLFCNFIEITWVLSCKFAAYFQNIFFQKHFWVAASEFCLKFLKTTLRGEFHFFNRYIVNSVLKTIRQFPRTCP